jgi:hypothetical protein
MDDPKRFSAALEGYEIALKQVMSEPEFAKIKHNYNELLAVLGNVDGDEVVGLVCVAIELVRRDKVEQSHRRMRRAIAREAKGKMVR